MNKPSKNELDEARRIMAALVCQADLNLLPVSGVFQNAYQGRSTNARNNVHTEKIPNPLTERD
jgi:hypothetical protein